MAGWLLILGAFLACLWVEIVLRGLGGNLEYKKKEEKNWVVTLRVCSYKKRKKENFNSCNGIIDPSTVWPRGEPTEWRQTNKCYWKTGYIRCMGLVFVLSEGIHQLFFIHYDQIGYMTCMGLVFYTFWPKEHPLQPGPPAI